MPLMKPSVPEIKVTDDHRNCLTAVADAGGKVHLGDERLNKFKTDVGRGIGERAPSAKRDVFTQCHDKGWLRSFHDEEKDEHFVRITEDGVNALGVMMSSQQKR